MTKISSELTIHLPAEGLKTEVNLKLAEWLIIVN